jgi:hypothetical protein
MTFHPKPYRSDFNGKLQWYTSHKTVEIATVFLVVVLPVSCLLASVLP